jgi:hypothetical protein
MVIPYKTYILFHANLGIFYSTDRNFQLQLFKGLLVQKIPLLIITMTLILGLSPPLHQQSLILVLFSGDPSAAISELTFLKNALAAHGQEITLTLHNSSFGSLSSGGGNQASVFASYELNDDSIAGQTINAAMEVYTPNEKLIRTSSYPNGFVAQSSGGVEGLETTIRDPTLQSVTADITFRNLDKTAMLSNDLRVELNLVEEGTTPTTTGEGVGLEEESLGLDSESELASSPPQQTEQEESGLGDELGEVDEDSQDEEQDEGQELPLPLFGSG